MTKEEFESIYRQHYAKMYRLARTMLYDADESKDVVSDIFARLLRERLRVGASARRAQPQVDARTGGKALLAGVDAVPDRFDE